jgi:hypothetical protein
MFKHIFPDKLNRLVYQQKRPGAAREAIKAAAKEKAKASPAELRREARELNKAINEFSKKVKEQTLMKEDVRRFNPVLKQLKEAKNDLLKGGASRANLDRVRSKMSVANIINGRLMRSKDPLLGLRASMPRVAKARARARSKAERAKARKESKERANMTKMAKLVEEFLATKRPITARRKAQIQNLLRDMASQVMGNRKRISAGGLTIEKAPGAGTDAFKFTLRQTRRLEQGRGLVRVTEKPVYAGGSAKDFPRRRA